MTSLVSHTSVDCRNAYELSEWWKQVLGYVDVDGDPNVPGHEECMILSPVSGHRLLFIEVPEAKRPRTGSTSTSSPVRHPRRGGRAGPGAGATEVDDLRGNCGPGTGWVVLADPEGNEFCILRSDEEKSHRSTG